MEIILAVLQLITRLFEALKAYLELKKGPGDKDEEEDDHPDARKYRPKHLRDENGPRCSQHHRP